MIAKLIQSKLSCDILELKSVVPYSDDYQTVVDEEQRLESSNHSPEIQDINVNLDDYDKIIIGAPVYWYTISPIVTTFLKKYNLTNKKIYPFATNAGWLGRTFNEIKKLCPNSEISNEMNIVFESYSDKLKIDKKEIDEWLDKIEKEN